MTFKFFLKGKKKFFLTQDYLKSILDYSLETGKFTWKVSSKKYKKGDVAGIPNWKGYLLIGVMYKKYRAHRLAWLYVKGCWPRDQIDHINGIKADNRWANLRQANNAENHYNIGLLSSNNTGYKGVTYDKIRKLYLARITLDKNMRYLGRFASAEEASLAYIEASKKLHKEFSIYR